jgi:hypothetical protein
MSASVDAGAGGVPVDGSDGFEGHETATDAGPIVVLHGPGDVDGGAGWRRSLRALGWAAAGPTLAGHAGEPPPVGGTHDLADPAYRAAAALTDHEASSAKAVVGIGASGWSATVMAVAGVGAALVLVDGLGDPWIALEDRLARRRRRLRRIADVASGAAPIPQAPAPGLDTSVAWWPDPIGDRELVSTLVAALTVPALIVRSPASEPPDPEIVAAFGTGADVVEVTDASPATVVPVVDAWLAGRSTGVKCTFAEAARTVRLDPSGRPGACPGRPQRRAWAATSAGVTRRRMVLMTRPMLSIVMPASARCQLSTPVTASS